MPPPPPDFALIRQKLVNFYPTNPPKDFDFLYEDFKREELSHPPLTLFFLNREWQRTDWQMQVYLNLVIWHMCPYNYMKIITDVNLGKDDNEEAINTLTLPAIVMNQKRTLYYCPSTRRDNVIYTYYYDKKFYGIGADKLFNVLSTQYWNIPLRYVREALHKTSEWQIHARIPGGTDQNGFVNRPMTMIGRPHRAIELDTTFMPNNVDKKHNCLLTCIDCFTKFAQAWPCWANLTAHKGSLSSDACGRACGAYIKEKAEKAKKTGGWLTIITDNGSEFQGDFENGLQELRKEGIKVEHRPGPSGSSKNTGQIEAFNKRLKNIIFTGFTMQGKLAYGEWYQQVWIHLNNYNDTPHSTTKMTPRELETSQDPKVWAIALKNIKEQGRKWLQQSAKFISESQKQIKPGDFVRRRTIKKLVKELAEEADANEALRFKNQLGMQFKPHSYSHHWTRQIYKVTEVHHDPPKNVSKLPWAMLVKVPPFVGKHAQFDYPVKEFISNLLKVQHFNISLANINIDNPPESTQKAHEAKHNFPADNAKDIVDASAKARRLANLALVHQENMDRIATNPQFNPPAPTKIADKQPLPSSAFDVAVKQPDKSTSVVIDHTQAKLTTTPIAKKKKKKKPKNMVPPAPWFVGGTGNITHPKR